jgi:hypothetical protein
MRPLMRRIVQYGENCARSAAAALLRVRELLFPQPLLSDVLLSKAVHARLRRTAWNCARSALNGMEMV